jgi:hypothetical protein
MWFKKKSFAEQYPEVVKALRFYADPANWKPEFKPGSTISISAMMRDSSSLGNPPGEMARKVLKDLNE